MLAWMSFVVVRAVGELNSSATVTGLIRDYHAPVRVADGWVIDPSERSIANEVIRRYAPNASLSTPNQSTVEGWSSWLTVLKLKPHLLKNEAPTRVHLRFRENHDTPDLWIARFGIEHILYRSGVGVIQTETMAPAHSIIQLDGATVRPW